MLARTRLLALALVASALLGGCASGDDAGEPAAPRDDGDLSVQVASFDLAVGPPSRFMVGLVTPGQDLVGFGTVDLRFIFVGTGRGTVPAQPSAPVRASYLLIPGATGPSPPPAEPRLAKGSERGVYVAQAGFDRPGFWQVEATARVDGQERRGTGAFQVGERHAVPAPGDPALPTENLTLSTPDAPRAAVDSRAEDGGEVPDPVLHGTTIAAALSAHRPVVAVFSTPVYCQSRFCGPVTDVVEELARSYADRASFVHVEIWRDFQGHVLNKAAADWLLRNDDLTEPWVFVIGADGRIAARFDNVVTRADLEPLLQQLPVIGPAA
ncbi:MAG TPA: hypothetical protein VHG90_10740 [Acidimicrobiales bacterium]|nr:hypothetical protein [Acidimicrobiales bacterium]